MTVQQPDRREKQDAKQHDEPRWMWRVLATLLVVVTVLIHVRTASDGLYLDDHHHVRPWTLREVLGTFSGPFDPLGLEPVYFRPLVVVTFALDWSLWGWTPAGFHATNIVLHAFASVLVLFLLRLLRMPPWPAIGGAALFAIIPANVATVAYVSERSDAMVAIFTMLGLLAVGRYLSDRRTIWLIALNGSYLLAIGSKEIGIAMILSTALLWWYLNIPRHDADSDGVVDHWRTELRCFLRPITDRSRWSDWGRVLVPMVVLALATILYRTIVLPTGPLSERYSETNPLWGFFSAVAHTFQMVPWELPATAAPLLALLAVVLFVGAPTSYGWRIVVLGVFWVAATCVPLAWLGQIEPRLLYVAQIGVAMVFAGLLVAAADAVVRLPRSLRTVGAGALTALVVLFVALSLRGTIDAQDQFAQGSPKMLGGDLQIWTDTAERREQWPAYWMPYIRERLLDAGLIAEDGSVIDDSGDR